MHIWVMHNWVMHNWEGAMHTRQGMRTTARVWMQEHCLSACSWFWTAQPQRLFMILDSTASATVHGSGQHQGLLMTGFVTLTLTLGPTSPFATSRAPSEGRQGQGWG